MFIGGCTKLVDARNIRSCNFSGGLGPFNRFCIVFKVLSRENSDVEPKRYVFAKVQG